MAVATDSKAKNDSKQLQAKFDRLTSRQKQFVEAILADVSMSPTEAARLAGYASPAISGHQLMQNKTINRLVSLKQNKRLERLELKADDILQFLFTALTHDPLESFVVAGDGTLALKELSKIPQPIRRLMTKIKSRSRDTAYGTETTIEVEWISKELALQLCVKHFGLAQDSVNVNVTSEDTMISKLREAIAADVPVIDDYVIDGTVHREQ